MKSLTLLYHEVVDSYDESGFQNNDNLIYMHKTDIFREHVDIFDTLEINKELDNLYISFDDGGISNLKSAQILEEKNLKGIYFITTNRTNTNGFLAENDIKKLDYSGHIIGSHSHTHPMIFRTLSYAKMIEEWRVSKEILEDILGKEITHCSIPGGDSDQKTYESAAEVGFKFIFDSEPIIEQRFINNSEILGRISIKANTTNKDLENILLLNNLATLQRNRKIKSTIKKMIFPIHQYIQNKKNG